MENILDYLSSLTTDETDMVIAYCIHNSSQYRKCLTFDEWMEQDVKERQLSFKNAYNLYIKECILTSEEAAREYYNK